MTITEMRTALKMGADIIKLSLGNAFGPDFIKLVWYLKKSDSPLD